MFKSVKLWYLNKLLKYYTDRLDKYADIVLHDKNLDNVEYLIAQHHLAEADKKVKVLRDIITDVKIFKGL